ncbi:hypothetical protein Tco_0366626 [Tanacetum coccineum]
MWIYPGKSLPLQCEVPLGIDKRSKVAEKAHIIDRTEKEPNHSQEQTTTPKTTVSSYEVLVMHCKGLKNEKEIFYTLAGNPVKEILLKLNLPDHRILKDGGEVKEFQRSFRHSDTERLSRSDEVLKLKNFKKDATLKLSKSTNQEWYEHVGPEVSRYKLTSNKGWRTSLCWVIS